MSQNPFSPDPIEAQTNETLGQMSRPALEKAFKFLIDEQAALIRGLSDQFGLVVARNENGVFYFHLHRPDPETGECHTGQWAVESGHITATILASLRALVKGELPERPPQAPADDANTAHTA